MILEQHYQMVYAHSHHRFWCFETIPNNLNFYIYLQIPNVATECKAASMSNYSCYFGPLGPFGLLRSITVYFGSLCPLRSTQPDSVHLSASVHSVYICDGFPLSSLWKIIPCWIKKKKIQELKIRNGRQIKVVIKN